MDKDIIFYILFGLIYLLSRAGRKKRQQRRQAQSQTQTQTKPQKQQPVPPQAQRPAASNPKTQPANQQEDEEAEAPLSFEEILRELAGEGRKKQQAAPSPAPSSRTNPPKPVHKPLVSEPQHTPEAPAYEQVPELEIKDEASDLWSAYKSKKSNRPAPAKDASTDEKEVDPYDTSGPDNHMAAEIREMLEDREDIKKAIILSEILNRRYQ